MGLRLAEARLSVAPGRPPNGNVLVVTLLFVDSGHTNRDMILSAPYPSCAGCKRPISDPFLLSIDGAQWHEDCVVCNMCGCVLRNSCQLREGKLYCKYDYLRKFGVCCAACDEPILRGQPMLQIRLRVRSTDQEVKPIHSASHRHIWPIEGTPEGMLSGYAVLDENGSWRTIAFHACCFVCCECGLPLCPGELYTVKGHLPMCMSDYHKRLHSLTQRECEGSGLTSGYECNVMEQLKSADHDQTPCLSPMPSSSDCSSRGTPEQNFDDELFELDSDSGSGKNCKRPRTILTSSQRRRFKSVFEQNPKPTRKIRESLAQETGLNIRVVQVWFQNQRAKMKKLARRQAQDSFHQLARRVLSCRSVPKETTVLSLHMTAQSMDAPDHHTLPVANETESQGDGRSAPLSVSQSSATDGAALPGIPPFSLQSRETHLRGAVEPMILPVFGPLSYSLPQNIMNYPPVSSTSVVTQVSLEHVDHVADLGADAEKQQISNNATCHQSFSPNISAYNGCCLDEMNGEEARNLTTDISPTNLTNTSAPIDKLVSMQQYYFLS